MTLRSSVLHIRARFQEYFYGCFKAGINSNEQWSSSLFGTLIHQVFKSLVSKRSRRCITAQWRADRCSSSTSPMFAPCDSSISTTTSYPPIMAWINGVRPSLSLSLRSALCSSRSRTILLWPICTALWSGLTSDLQSCC